MQNKLGQASTVGGKRSPAPVREGRRVPHHQPTHRKGKKEKGQRTQGTHPLFPLF
jgi:hypothetical protein